MSVKLFLLLQGIILPVNLDKTSFARFNRFVIALMLASLLSAVASCQQPDSQESSDPSGTLPAGSKKALQDAPLSLTPEVVTRATPGQTTGDQATDRGTSSEEETTSSHNETPDQADSAATVIFETATPGEPLSTETTSAVEPTVTLVAGEKEGALVAITMEGQVGVLLDEVPVTIRDRVVDSLLQRPTEFWSELARRQVKLTGRRLNFRNFVYDDKGQLPLPPETLWTFTLDPDGPARTSVQGHDLVTIDYTFESTLLTDAQSLAEAEPALSQEEGQWREPFVFPLDPDQILQRTGNACLNEAGFPPNSFDSENVWVFYDYTCEGDSGGLLGCHRTQLNTRSCLEAIEDQVGSVERALRFERLTWDPALADRVRQGAVTHYDGPDLQVVGDDLEQNRVIYRYFPDDSCALVEQCVGDSGWRRLLQFSATVHNVGAVAMDVGPVVAENPLHNLFQYNSCHNHFHFSDYGDFFFSGTEQGLSSKQAFCVESTSRLSNNEWSPLTHDFSCRVQGVQAGWVDEYHAGLDCQWIDITDFDIPDDGAVFDLGFSSNPNKFLCEGNQVFDDQGNQLWEPSGLTTPDGHSIDRPSCEFVPEWDVNNLDARPVILEQTGSFVSQPCNDRQLGPLRNCDFVEGLTELEVVAGEQDEENAGDESQPSSSESSPDEPEDGFACEPDRPVQLSCSLGNASAPQVLRVCEYSHALENGVACTFQDALANAVVSQADQEETRVDFTCPGERDQDEPGGQFVFYTAPVFDEDPVAPVSCILTP